MSRVYFHTPTETVEVYGTERAWMAELCRKVAGGAFRMVNWEKRKRLLPADSSVHRHEQLGIVPAVDYAFDSYLGSFMGDHFTDGEEVFSCVLNTCLDLGSDALALCARIHGQCELHGYVEPQDGEFIASIIERGLESSVMRETLTSGGKTYDNGWREVCRVLRKGELVVSSYSVCEGFPNQWVALEGGTWQKPICPTCGDRGSVDNECEICGGEGRLDDTWYDLSAEMQWSLASQALVKNIQGLRWGEENWTSFYFGSGKTAFDYVRGD